MILLSHPTGNANVRAVAKSLCERNALAEFHTTLAFPRHLPIGRRRQFPEVPWSKVHIHPLREAFRHLTGVLGVKSLFQHETGAFCVDAVYRSLDRAASRRLQKSEHIQAVYSYEDGALATFREARRLEIQRFYDLPIGYWRAARRIQTEEAERLPEWAPTMPALIDSSAKCARKDDELKLSSMILVASRFTAESLKEAPFELPPVHVVPYGCPTPFQNPEYPEQNRAGGGRLRVLFVGSLGQRKGLSYLFDAVRGLSSAVELTLIGRKPNVECKPLEAELARHRWIPSLPHAGILEEMRRHDVLVFPSLFEGFGLVVTEALSQGIPVITTPHTCGPDVLTEGDDGFIVSIRDALAIRERLELLHRDRVQLEFMKRTARTTAQRLTWESYRQGVAETVCNQMTQS